MWLFCLNIVILPCKVMVNDLTQFEGGKCYIHVLLLIRKHIPNFMSDFQSVNIPQCQNKKTIFKNLSHNNVLFATLQISNNIFDKLLKSMFYFCTSNFLIRVKNIAWREGVGWRVNCGGSE